MITVKTTSRFQKILIYYLLELTLEGKKTSTDNPVLHQMLGTLS